MASFCSREPHASKGPHSLLTSRGQLAVGPGPHLVPGGPHGLQRGPFSLDLEAPGCARGPFALHLWPHPASNSEWGPSGQTLGMPEVFGWASPRSNSGSAWRMTHLRQPKTKVKLIRPQLGKPKLGPSSIDLPGLIWALPDLLRANCVGVNCGPTWACPSRRTSGCMGLPGYCPSCAMVSVIVLTVAPTRLAQADPRAGPI